MHTTVNGKPAKWSAAITRLFAERVPPVRNGDVITDANYFTPRPYVDEYNRGSDKAGFVYTLHKAGLVYGTHVCFVEWPEEPKV